MVHRTAALVVVLTVPLLTVDAFAQKKRAPNPAFAKVKDDPKLPRVLIIGDSISIGYTVPLREELQGEANVHRIPVNGGPTTRGLAEIEEWLGDGDWDVIHFNWGLHDLKSIDKDGKLVAVDRGETQVPIDEYRQNLQKLVDRLQQTGAVLIWRNTTPVPEGANGRKVGDADRYNEVARQIMEAENIAIDDHYTFVIDHPDLQLPANVHFTDEGSRQLAKRAAAAIRQGLKQRSGKDQ